MRSTRSRGNWLTPEHCDFVLALVARRLRVDTLAPPQYRAERDAMLAGRSGAAELRLPTDVQIAAASGTWDRALAHAGLRARSRRGTRNSGPASIIDVLDRCYEHHGAEPTIADLEQFARANGIPFPRKDRPYSDLVNEWKQTRRDQGLAVPDGPPPTSQRPDYTVDVGAARPGERRARKRWDDTDEIINWVSRYLTELKPRQRASQRGYDQWARNQEGAPWSAVIGRHGGWAAVRDAARERLRQR